MSDAPRPGDRIVIGRDDGKYDVATFNDAGVEEIRRETLYFKTASEIAVGHANGGRVWCRRQSRPGAIEHFRS